MLLEHLEWEAGACAAQPLRLVHKSGTLSLSARGPASACAVAARGLDVKDLVLVVNYDVPNHHEDYVHRWGGVGWGGVGWGGEGKSWWRLARWRWWQCCCCGWRLRLLPPF